jgi:hypothetical protein
MPFPNAVANLSVTASWSTLAAAKSECEYLDVRAWDCWKAAVSPQRS